MAALIFARVSAEYTFPRLALLIAALCSADSLGSGFPRFAAAILATCSGDLGLPGARAAHLGLLFR